MKNNIHSELHYIAEEVSKFVGEPKRFAMYLGIIKKLGKDKTWQIISEMKQNGDIKNRAKYFMGCYRNSRLYKQT